MSEPVVRMGDIDLDWEYSVEDTHQSSLSDFCQQA